MIKLALLALIGGGIAMLLRRNREDEPQLAGAPDAGSAGYDDVTHELRQLDDAATGERY
jgi:hypothetical protein